MSRGVAPRSHTDDVEDIASRQLSRRNVLQAAAIGAAATVIPGAKAVASVVGSPRRPEANELQIFEGIVQSSTGTYVDVLYGESVRRVPITAGSSLWRGDEAAFTALRRGDSLLLRLSSDAHLERAWANLDRVHGIVQGIDGDAFVLDVGNDQEVELRLANHASVADVFTSRPIQQRRFGPGTAIDAIGMRSGHTLHGTNLRIATPDAKPAHASVNGPDGVLTSRSAIIPENMNCIYTYTGIATWFVCSTGAGRCVTCSTAKSNQCAWPALDTGCSCCGKTCCSCSSGCKGQVYLSCGKGVDVTDSCSSKVQTVYIADCGPCQNASCGYCIKVCSHTCSLCGISRTTPVVDLTKPTFAWYRDPATYGCFPASVKAVVTQPTC